ncbi:MAG: NAD(P)/FAD-dependent oxidoreductase [Hellea sp.]|nr:NAD(P)/FAD-dependent oxidoreductase [Hellea sp.]
MAFADIILSETDKDIILVDRYPKPGGHWNVAYPYVTLHQPSQYYGVSSKELSSGLKDQIGLNKGLSDLASGQAVSAYYDDVMRHQFLPSGRVQYFPMCNFLGDGRFVCMLSGKTYTVDHQKMVDATWLKTSVPSTHKPNFKVEDGVNFIPLNDLTKITKAPDGYVVIGAGKTGIDAVLWLLENRVDPDNIRWIMPRDAWLLDRKNTQPSEAFFENTMGAQASQFEAIIASKSIEDMFNRLEDCGYFLRIDKNVRPKMFHGATISKMEVEELRRVKQVIRLGRVQRITKTEIILDQGIIPTRADIIHVDCSARAVSNEEIKPVFEGKLITPQMVRSYQPVFSAAAIAHVEAAYEDEDEKNRLCGVVPLPNHDTDYIRFTAAFMMNQYNWGQDRGMRHWLLDNRLDGFSKMAANVDPEDADKIAILKRIRKSAPMAAMKLQQYLSQLERPTG